MNDPATIDRERLVTRLTALKEEFASGHRLLGELESKAAALREQLLRINGAARVVEELLVEP
jgi:hypothetical protein